MQYREDPVPYEARRFPSINWILILLCYNMLFMLPTSVSYPLLCVAEKTKLQTVFLFVFCAKTLNFLVYWKTQRDWNDRNSKEGERLVYKWRGLCRYTTALDLLFFCCKTTLSFSAVRFCYLAPRLLHLWGWCYARALLHLFVFIGSCMSLYIEIFLLLSQHMFCIFTAVWVFGGWCLLQHTGFQVKQWHHLMLM